MTDPDCRDELCNCPVAVAYREGRAAERQRIRQRIEARARTVQGRGFGPVGRPQHIFVVNPESLADLLDGDDDAR